MQLFDHEKLYVYLAAVKFVVLTDRVIGHFPKGRAYIADQLQRAGLSIALNIAEGAGEFSPNEKIRFYRMAKRSATECAGVFDVCKQLQILEGNSYGDGRDLLLQIVSMLTKMTQKTE